jgi:hypothetical protein
MTRSAARRSFGNDAFERPWEKGETTPKTMTVEPRLRIVGRPARLSRLDRAPTYMTAKGHAGSARRGRIAQRRPRLHDRRARPPRHE